MERHQVAVHPMKLAKAVSAVIAAICLLAVSTASASTHDNRPKILIHLKPVTTKAACDTLGPGEIADCSSYSQVTVKGTSGRPGSGPFYFGYLVVARGTLPGIAGLQCGIYYQDGDPGNMNDQDRIDILNWTLCAELQFITTGSNAWPRPGGGNLITWDLTRHCQTGETAVAGYFYLACYNSQDYLSVIPRPVDAVAKVANCSSTETALVPTDLGWVAFSTCAVSEGCNPCYGICHTGDPFSASGAASCMTSPTLGLHVTPADEAPTCSSALLFRCEDAATRGAVLPAGLGHYVYVIGDPGLDGSNLKGLRFGITYQGGDPAGASDEIGIDVLSWESCATSESPSAGWPAPGSGNLLQWSNPNCSTDRPLVAGYFYVSAFSEDTLHVAAEPGEATAEVVLCNNSTRTLGTTRLGSAIFTGGVTEGCNPCDKLCPAPTAVEPATWSGIKSLFTR